MLKILKKWLGKTPAQKAPEPMDMLRKTGSHRALRPTAKPAPGTPRKPQAQPKAANPSKPRTPGRDVDTEKPIIEEVGPGKNVLVRRMVREESGTHETLKILDDSVIEGEEESGLDPYNTGQFDRSKYWDKRFLK